ncbi:MAG: HdeD family acid-resistance protein [Phycisphaerales bacterium]|nr:HdeD family acid-resistance protein [Phycisphaerales bacterium]MCI0676517.1 HdeD family acid-resistance protein [Phycisphaerales bacterium]
MLFIAGSWWAFVLRGIVAILFGIMALVLPRMALLTLVFLFGFFALADGIFSLIMAFRGSPDTMQPRQPWWALLIHGLISVAAGIAAFVIPGLTAIALLYLIAAWAVAAGVLEIIVAIRLRKQIRGEWLLALTGVLSILFGILVAIFPSAGALAVVLWIGIYALIVGGLLIALGLRLRKVGRDLDQATHMVPG